MRKLLLLLLASAGCAFAQHAVMLSVQWQDDTGVLATGATVSVLVQRSTTSGSGYSTIATLSATLANRQVYSYIDAATPSNVLLEGVTYYYVILVQSSNGNSSALTAELASTIPTVTNGRHLSAVDR